MVGDLGGGVAASWSAGRASGTSRGREGEGQGSSDTFLFFVFFFDREVRAKRCGIRLQVEVPQRNIVAWQPVNGSQ